MAETTRVLIADDQPDVLEALRLLLKGEGFETETATSPAGILAALERWEYDAVLMDLNYARDTTSGKEGLDLVTKIQALDSTLPIVVMTAWGSVAGAVEAIRRGARDYIEKPWDNSRLIATLRTQSELGRVMRESQRLKQENRLLRKKDDLPEMIADSRAMQNVLRLIERVAASDANVLITGEHGTGKEVVARRLHALSNRADKPLIAVNVGGLSEGVFESEMFGHVKGAFTDAKTDRVGYFELADKGTLFLDEIGNLNAKQQARLLRVLQTGEMQRVGSSKTRKVDVRIISATNADIQQEVDEGRFREDLLYRLNTVVIDLPPLRDRGEDIGLLAEHFLRRFAGKYGRRSAAFDGEARRALQEYRWPGNVRELEHVLERGILMAPGDTVRAEDLGLAGRRAGAPALDEMTLEEAEQLLIRKALERYQGNVSRAADALGLSRSALYRRLQQYGIST
ncbi:MAG TPA: sigma-54 dependent transcriptional regulator [Longimicrobiales bacterium]|nr:sigma-54 dependent transcriptional regulator [Longimicrobiales bacterium]